MENENFIIKLTKTKGIQQIKRCLPQGMLIKRRHRKYRALFTKLNTTIEDKNLTIIKLLTEYSKSGMCVLKTRKVLYCAIKQGNLDITRFFLEQYPRFSLEDTNCESLTSFYIAIKNQKIHVLRYLLNKGVNVNAYCKCQQTPLYVAAALGSVEMVNLLLEYNAKVNICDQDEESPLYRAVVNGHNEVAKVLVRAGTDLNEEGLLSAAIEVGMNEIVEDLIQRGANIFQDKFLMREATTVNNLEAIKILHRAGVLLTDVNDDGDTALMNACRYGQFSIIEYMLKNGVSLNTINEANGMTALHYSIEQHEDSAGYTGFLCDERGYPVLFEKLLELFLEYDVILEQKSSKGENIFSCALGFVNFKVLRMLVKYGFDVKCIEETWVNTMLTNILSVKRHKLNWDEYIQEKLDDLNDLVKLVFCAGFEFKNELILKDLDDRIFNFIVHLMRRPRSLKDLCRIRIRKLLGKKVMVKLYKLPLPKCMHDFLALDIL